MFPHRQSSKKTILHQSPTPITHPINASKEENKVLCYGHRCVELTDNRFLNVGGFGVSLQDGGHRRLDIGSIIQLEDGVVMIFSSFFIHFNL